MGRESLYFPAPSDFPAPSYQDLFETLYNLFRRFPIPLLRDRACLPPAYAEASAGFAEDTSGTMAARPS